MAETVFLRRLSRWQAEQQRETFADVYVEAYRGVAGEDVPDRRDFLQRFAADVQLPAFDMVIASGPGAVVGCAYGHRADRTDGSRRYPGGPGRADGAGRAEGADGAEGADHADIDALTAAGRVFALAELMVLPSHRRQGVATSMLEQLFVRTDAALATARIARANSAARAAYRAWEWEERGTWPLEAAGAEGTTAVRDLWTRRLRP